MITKLENYPKLTTPLAHLLMSDIRHLANSESGPCYLFGNGGSLKYANLQAFSDRPAITCNLQFLHLETPFLQNKYFMALDPISTLGDPGSPLRESFIRYMNIHGNTNFFLSMRDKFRIRGKNIFHLAPIGTSWPGAKTSLVGKSLSSKSNPLKGSLRGQISLAIFLGFESATLVGHDYLIQPTISGHFYEIGVGEEVFLGEWNEDFIKQAREFIDLEIVSVRNSECKTMPIIPIQKLQKITQYRENKIILGENEFQILNQANVDYNFGYKLY